ncbi:MAG: endopeptidase La [Alkalispirochaeta sp.]
MRLFGDRGDRRRLPVFPLANSVLFPGVSVPLVVRAEAEKAVINTAMEADRAIVIVPQPAEAVAAEHPPEAGTISHIHHVARMPDGGMRVVVEGRQRVKVDDPQEDDGLRRLRCTPINPDHSDPDKQLPGLVRVVRETLQEYVTLHPTLGSRVSDRLEKADGADRLVDLAGGNLPLDLSLRLQLLGEAKTVRRVGALAESLQHEVELLGMKRSIRDRVRKRLEHGQKEYFLQEQIKEINRELGRDDQDESFGDLRARIDAAHLPETVRARADREFSRLKKVPPVSPEAGIIQTYLEWLLDLPWQRQPSPPIDISRAREILDGDHHGLREPKDRLLEFMAVQTLNGDLKGPILCFVGPPGTGKTSLGRSMARALAREFVRLSLGGMRDEAEIRGHRRTYVGAMPGRIIQSIRKAGTHNPVILLDEIDKMGADFRGDPSSALLEVLDPEQNNTFSDHYIELEYDLSQVTFLTTANGLSSIPQALRDRLEIISVPGYTEQEKTSIARQFLVPEQNRENGAGDPGFTFRGDALHALIHDYSSESGVRTLKRQIATVMRKLLREHIEKSIPEDKRQRHVTAGTVRRLLGPPRHRRDAGDGIARAGLARGVAWTEVGGVLLSIESVSYPGTGRLVLTGSLGDVMKESAQTALSLVRSRAESWHIVSAVSDRDIHIHVPEGAVPKDGPSAGITVFAAILSLFRDEPLAGTVAMTGELTLTGRVLPVGGIREKVLAARRAEITDIILPAGNREDLDELPSDARRGITFHPVTTVEEIIPLIFDSTSSPQEPEDSENLSARKGTSPLTASPDDLGTG